ncbi:MAG: hypothetical protein IJR87_10150 [Bacteroidaceae bacterium]|nr:hypothetical protein [Bacteroidaceae bacterium]
MDTEAIRKEFEKIRQERAQFGNDPILDAWEANVLFRNQELEHRVDYLEKKVFFQSAANYAFVIIIGLLAGAFLFHVFG